MLVFFFSWHKELHLFTASCAHLSIKSFICIQSCSSHLLVMHVYFLKYLFPLPNCCSTFFFFAFHKKAKCLWHMLLSRVLLGIERTRRGSSGSQSSGSRVFVTLCLVTENIYFCLLFGVVFFSVKLLVMSSSSGTLTILS